MHRVLAALIALLLAALTASAQTVRTTLPTSDSARAVALNPVTNKAYVINEFANTVSVIDGATAAVTATIALGDGTRPQYIAVNPQTNRIYVSRGDASLTIIDGATDTPASYAIGSTGPIAINPITGVVFVVRLSSPATDEVTLVNDNGSSVTWQSIATNSFQPMDVTLDPLTNFYYVIHYPAGHIRQVDGNSSSDFPPSTQVDVGKPGILVAMNQVSRRVYTVTGSTTSPMGVIDANNLAFTPISAAVSKPTAVAVNPVTNKVYVAFDGQVVVIDGATNALSFIASGVAGSGPVSIGVNVITNKIYVPNANGTMTVIDGDTNATTTVAIPAGANYVAVNPVTNTAYVTSPSGVTLVNGASSDAAHAIPLTTAISQSTSGASPTFQFTATSTYSPGTFPVQRVYYQVDSLTGPWQLATGGGPFTGAAAGLAAGRHVIYAFAADGQDVPLTGLVSSPIIGAISQLAFEVGTAPPKVDPAVALSVTPNPATQGQSVTLTATVSGSAGTPTGSVSFMEGTAAVAGCSSAALFNGAATCVTSGIAAGSHSITAQYGGDAGYNAKNSSATTLTVSAVKVDATVTLASSMNPSVSGQSISFTATLTGPAGTPSGSVTFRDGSTAIAGCSTVPVTSGHAACNTAALATGSHSITAAYSGDTQYNAATSNTVAQTVSAPTRASATVAVASSANPSAVNQAVTLTATVSGSAGTPSGAAAFLDGGSEVPGCASLTLSATGTAACSTNTLTAGNHAITVQYSGDAAYDSATSASFTQAVNAPAKANATFSFDSSANPSNAGQAVTLQLTLSGTSGSPTGSVSFLDSAAPITGCTALTLSGASASCTASFTAGTHSITVQYSGDSGYNASTSSAYIQQAAGRRGLLDFDGDGKADLVMRNDDGSVAIWLMDGVVARSTPTVLGASSGATVVKAADFDGDGVTDLVREVADGTSTMYFMSGGAIRDTAVLRQAASGWHLTHAVDLNGDGKADLLWRNDNGAVEAWIMNGGVTTATATLMPAGTSWRIAKVGDFNGDGKADLLWFNGTDGSVGMWLMDGTTVASRTPVMGPQASWIVADVGDFNGDGKADIAWENADGSVGLWLMDGATQLARRTVMAAGTGWSLTRVADVDGDGKADIVWTHTDGSVGLWLMNGLDIAQRTSLLGPGTGWVSSAAVDANGDSKADLAWAHASGAVGLWLMNGITVTQRGTQLPAGTPWHLVNEQAEANTP